MIEINNLTSTPLDKKGIKAIGKKVLSGERINADISIAFVSPKIIKSANKKYRKKNRITDVLSFPEPSKAFFKKGAALGEIIICPSFVKKNAKKFKTPFKKELSRILIHGILHLLGYEHEKSEREKIEMQKKEEYYLERIKLLGNHGR